MHQQFAHQVALLGVGQGVQVMRVCVLLALVAAASTVKSLWGSVSNHADKRGGALRQEDDRLFGASAGVDYASMQHLASGWERQGMVTSDLNNRHLRSSASSEQAA